jgi:hypothetical protein
VSAASECHGRQVASPVLLLTCSIWLAERAKSGRGDLNPRPSAPKVSAEDDAGEGEGGECRRFPRDRDGGRSCFE